MGCVQAAREARSAEDSDAEQPRAKKARTQSAAHSPQHTVCRTQSAAHSLQSTPEGAKKGLCSLKWRRREPNGEPVRPIWAPKRIKSAALLFLLRVLVILCHTAPASDQCGGLLGRPGALGAGGKVACYASDSAAGPHFRRPLNSTRANPPLAGGAPSESAPARDEISNTLGPRLSAGFLLAGRPSGERRAGAICKHGGTRIGPLQAGHCPSQSTGSADDD